MQAEISVHGGTPESRDLYGRIQRAIGLTERLNRIPFADGDAIRQAWSELTGMAVDATFSLIPPVYSEHGLSIRVGRNVFINNFFSTSFLASGGTEPYTWSGQVPAGLTLRPSGLLLGAPSVKGTSTFNVTVTDASGATATGTFSLTVTDPPPPTPPGCQTGGVRRESLSGPAFNGQTPSGQATADMTRFSGCGGFSLLDVQVNNVNLPDGTQLWVTLDFGSVGTITLQAGSGTMATYNMGRFGVSTSSFRVSSRSR